MIRILAAFAALIGLTLTALGLTFGSPIALFDALGPRDQGGRLALADAAFGEDPRQRLDVFVPTAPATHSAPVLVFFYGGAWSSGDKDDYAFAAQAFAAQGFVTVLPDYRLHPTARFPDFLDDGAAAIAWVRDNIAAYGGDPRRIVLAGHSAGAYNAVMLGLDPQYLRKAGIDPRVIKAVAGLSGPYDFLPLADHPTAQKVFGDVADAPSTQPVNFTGPHSPPAFLATGLADKTVRPQNTTALAARLREARVPVQERYYSDLDHQDTLLALSVTFRAKAPELAEMAAFLRQHSNRRSVMSVQLR